VLIIVLWTTK